MKEVKLMTMFMASIDPEMSHQEKVETMTADIAEFNLNNEQLCKLAAESVIEAWSLGNYIGTPV